MRLVLWFCAAVAAGACSKAPETADAAPPAAAESPASDPLSDPLTDRFWTLAETDGRAGVIRAFLSDGSMLQGSCWEPYRLSAWRRSGDGAIVWTEDGVEISAAVIETGPDALTIGINLPGGQKVERYRPAAAPFVCPDLPR